jgi:hypothetical protein
MKWRGKGGYPPEQERERQRMVQEAREHEEHRKRLQAIKNRLDLYGPDGLEEEEVAEVYLHWGFFYPDQK